MSIRLSDDVRERSLSSIKRYVEEHMDEEIGDLKAGMLLDYVLAEIGPSVYNQAVADVQAVMHERVTDIDGTCFKPEFGYWKR